MPKPRPHGRVYAVPGEAHPVADTTYWHLSWNNL